MNAATLLTLARIEACRAGLELCGDGASEVVSLGSEFSTVGERISFDHADRLLALLDQVGPAMMEQLAEADIKFVSTAARGRLLRKKHGLD